MVSGRTAFIAAAWPPARTLECEYRVGGVNNAGATISCAASPLTVRRVGKAVFLFEIEGVAAARLAWFRSTRMFDEIFGHCGCRVLRVLRCVGR